MELSINKITNCECGNGIKASDKFCSACGHHFRMMRSKQEIEAEIEKIKNLDKRDEKEAMVRLMGEFFSLTALDWVLGNKLSPTDLINHKKHD